MDIIVTIVFSYFALVLLTALYVKKDHLPDAKNILVVVLSGKNKKITKDRLEKGIQIQQITKGKIAVCGKEMSEFMVTFLRQHGVKNLIVQSKSLNTDEDATFLRRMIGSDYKLVLISSPTHQRRAWHHFKKVFPENIYNSPSSQLQSFDSVLKPIGWIGMILNIVKDYKYNKKIW